MIAHERGEQVLDAATMCQLYEINDWILTEVFKLDLDTLDTK